MTSEPFAQGWAHSNDFVSGSHHRHHPIIITIVTTASTGGCPCRKLMTVARTDITPVPPSFFHPLHLPPLAPDSQFHPHPFGGAAKSPPRSPDSPAFLTYAPPACSPRSLRPSRPFSSSRVQLPWPCPPPIPRVPHLTRCFSAMPFRRKMQAGPMGNCMEGPGSTHCSLDGSPPSQPPRWLSLLISFSYHFSANPSCLSWPLPRSLCRRAVTAGQEISPRDGRDGEGSQRFVPPHLA